MGAISNMSCPFAKGVKILMVRIAILLLTCTLSNACEQVAWNRLVVGKVYGQMSAKKVRAKQWDETKIVVSSLDSQRKPLVLDVDNSGNFQVPVMPPGDYEVKVLGLSKRIIERITVIAGPERAFTVLSIDLDPARSPEEALSSCTGPAFVVHSFVDPSGSMTSKR